LDPDEQIEKKFAPMADELLKLKSRKFRLNHHFNISILYFGT
jgi:hypothetical protein